MANSGANPPGYDLHELNTILQGLSGGATPSFAMGLFGGVQSDIAHRRALANALAMQKQQAAQATRQKQIAAVLNDVLTGAQGGATYGATRRSEDALSGALGLGQGAQRTLDNRVNALYPAMQTGTVPGPEAGVAHGRGTVTPSPTPTMTRSGGETSPLFASATQQAQRAAALKASLSPSGPSPDRYELGTGTASNLVSTARAWAQQGKSPAQIISGLEKVPDLAKAFVDSPQQVQGLLQLVMGQSSNSRTSPAGGNPVGGSSQGGASSAQGSGSSAGMLHKIMGGAQAGAVSAVGAGILGKALTKRFGYGPGVSGTEARSAYETAAGTEGSTGVLSKLLGGAGLAYELGSVPTDAHTDAQSARQQLITQVPQMLQRGKINWSQMRAVADDYNRRFRGQPGFSPLSAEMFWNFMRSTP